MNSPTFTFRLGGPERTALTRLGAAGRSAGRSTTPSEAVRGALRFAADGVETRNPPGLGVALANPAGAKGGTR